MTDLTPIIQEHRSSGDDLIADLLEELERLRAERQWQPIDTAPKIDRERILLFWGGAWGVGFWLDNEKSLRPWSGWSVPSLECRPSGKPTHWMSFDDLPKPKDTDP